MIISSPVGSSKADHDERFLAAFSCAIAPMSHLLADLSMGKRLRAPEADVLPPWFLAVPVSCPVGHPDELGWRPRLRVRAELDGVAHEAA